MSYEINDEFEAKSKRLTIQDDQAKQKNWDMVPEKVQEAVVEDRRGHVDSIIVKVMKEDKELIHKELVNKVMPLLKFPQERTQVAERVEELIKRGFLEGYKKDAKQAGEQEMEVDEGKEKEEDDPVGAMLIKYVV